jgi:hypothetical protein
MQSGELVVSSKGDVNILLEKLPAEVKVHFKHEKEIVPCNPSHVDELQYSVHTNNNSHHYKFVLIIKWNVSGVREIVWEALY